MDPIIEETDFFVRFSTFLVAILNFKRQNHSQIIKQLKIVLLVSENLEKLVLHDNIDSPGRNIFWGHFSTGGHLEFSPNMLAEG